MANYTYGSFVLNNFANGLGYLVTAKELPTPVVKAVQFNIARRDGTKKSGEAVDARQLTITVKIVGSSRLDLLTKLDALQQALALRGQALVIHDSGTRYYQNVDAIQAPCSFKAGNGVVSCEVGVVFLVYDPYSYSNSLSTYDTGTVALTLANGLWNFPSLSLTGGGSQYSYPLIRLYNRTSTGSTTLSAGLTSGTNYTSISVAATPFSGLVGDTIIITHSGTSQTLTVTTGFSVGATTISVQSFTAGASYVSGDTAAKNTLWNSLTITQVTDNQTLNGTSTVGTPLPQINGDYVDIQCDPSVQYGWTIQTNNSGKWTEPIGVFPVMEPGQTVFGISIASGSAVSAEAVLSWLPRYMA